MQTANPSESLRGLMPAGGLSQTNGAAAASARSEPVLRLEPNALRAERTTDRRGPAPVLARARGEGESDAARIAELETRLAEASRALKDRDETIARLEARNAQNAKMLDDSADLAGALEVAKAGAVSAVEELEREVARRAKLTRQLVDLRREVDWRDYALRDLEPLAERARDLEAQLARARHDHAAVLAGRDAEIERLRLELEAVSRRAVA